MIDFFKLMLQQAPFLIEIKKVIDQILELPYFKEIALLAATGSVIIAIIKKGKKPNKRF